MTENPKAENPKAANPKAANPRTATRRSSVAVEAERRSTERKARLAGDIRQMRTRRKWTQQDLASRADIGRMVLSRIERGAGPFDLETLDRIAIALEVPLAVGFDRDPRVDVADAGHLAIQEIVLRLGRAAGATTQFELPTRPNEPWRSADVVLGWPARRSAIEVECWNTFGDLGVAIRSSRRKLVELDQLVAGSWGPDAEARLVWVVRESAANRRLLGRYPEVFASTFTGPSRAWVDALTTGSTPPDEPGLVWCDVSTGRLHAWRKPSR